MDRETWKAGLSAQLREGWVSSLAASAPRDRKWKSRASKLGHFTWAVICETKQSQILHVRPGDSSGKEDD